MVYPRVGSCMDVPTHQRDPRSDDAEGHPVTSSQVYMRNYDPYWEYDLTVTVRDGAGNLVYDRRYYFQPGQVKHERDPLQPGEYEVTVELDNRQRKTETCRVSADPDHTIHVELGNGLVSITEGLY